MEKNTENLSKTNVKKIVQENKLQLIQLFIYTLLAIFMILLPHFLKMNKTLAIDPENITMLVSLDGEEDEYYEEIKVFYNGKRVDSKKIKWHSNNPDIADISEDGWITSNGVGKTEITAAYKGLVAKCVVVVKQKITSDTFGE